MCLVVSFKVTTRIQMIYCIDASRAGALSSLIAGNKLIFVLDPTTPFFLSSSWCSWCSRASSWQDPSRLRNREGVRGPRQVQIQIRIRIQVRILCPSTLRECLGVRRPVCVPSKQNNKETNKPTKPRGRQTNC